jgi:hypothetical protein
MPSTPTAYLLLKESVMQVFGKKARRLNHMELVISVVSVFDVTELESRRVICEFQK